MSKLAASVLQTFSNPCGAMVLCWCSVLRVVCSLALCVGARFVLVVDRRCVFFFGSEEPLRSLDSFQW